MRDRHILPRRGLRPHAVLLGLLAGLASPLAAAAAEKHVVLTRGKPSGAETIERKGDWTVATYHFNDRGRGPEIKARWRVDAAGIPVEIEIRGKAYMKTHVDERYSLDAKGRASWTSADERGSQDAAQGAVYIPANAPPSYGATLVQALAKAPGQRLRLLPAGEARLEKFAERTLPGAAGTKAIGYEVHGLDYVPSPVWLDADMRPLAGVSSWFSVVRAGEEAAVPELLAAQEARDLERAKTMATRLTHRPAGPLLVGNARLYDPRDGSVAPGSSVLVIGNRIAAAGPDGSFAVPDGTERVDAGDRFLMPGLWDNHVHMGGIDGLLHLAAGVTSVRDMANSEDELPQRVQRYDSGEEIGPRVLMSGFIDGPGPFAGPTKVLIDNLADAQRWVDWYADHGYVQVKLYSSLKTELVPEIARMVHARGMRLSGHVPAFMTAEQFVQAGADEIQHLNFVFLNFLAKEAADTRNMTRFIAVGEHAGSIDPAGERERALIALFKQHHTTLDPTINIFEDMFDGAPGRITPGYEPVVPRLPPQVARGLVGGNIDPPKGKEANFRVALASMKRFLKALHEAGIPMVPGTDSPVGFGLHRELEVWVSAGIPNAAVLRAATLGSAEVNRRAGERGVVAAGWLADFILVDGDPLREIADIRRVRTVVKDGKVFDAAALYAAVGVKPAP